MKKLLGLCLALLILTPILFFGYRHTNNINSVIPYPFIFKKDIYKNVDGDAPILIVGDIMAKRLGTFKKLLSQKISGDIEKPIEIISLAQDEEGLHRTFEKIKNLERLPFVIIYVGNTAVDNESLFHNKDIYKIVDNFNIYHDPLVQSLLLVFPNLSRYVYNTIDYVYLDNNVLIENNNPKNLDHVFQKRSQMYFKLYEAMLNEFFSFTLKKNSVVIPVTTPINLKVKPQRSCYGSFDPNSKQDYQEVLKLYKKRDFKGAYSISKDLVIINSTHAGSLFLHGLISEKLNKFKESQKYFELAIAYDCNNQRGSPIYNAILKNMANKNALVYIDFHQYLVDQSHTNHTFIDELYPQDFYVEKLTDMLALRIKKLLKL